MPESQYPYEPDLSRPGPLWWVLVLTMVGVLGLSWLIHSLFTDASSPAGTLDPIVTQHQAVPKLQSAPLQDYERFHQEAVRQLNSVGWVDREAGIVHMPIEQAMDLLVERGLREAEP